MPYKSPHPCKVRNCAGLAQSGESYCPAHQHLKRGYDKKRPPSSQRGYGWNWSKARTIFLAEHPLCEECLREGKTEAATVVDHIVPMRKGGSQYDGSNLQSLCKQHHDEKTAREDGGFGNI